MGEVIGSDYQSAYTGNQIDEAIGRGLEYPDISDGSVGQVPTIGADGIEWAYPIDRNAGAHNSIYRGRYLGNEVTAAQYDAIDAGTFDDLFIGDYWTIGDVNWRIAAFDYYLTTGDTACNTHHVVIVPDTSLYNAKMNDSNTTTGGYVGSKMYTNNLADAKSTINNYFSGHVLSHGQYLCNAVTNGRPSGGAWFAETVIIMTECNVYGARHFGVGNDGVNVPTLYSIDKSQFPLFQHRPDLQTNLVTFWLRDVVSASNFAIAYNRGGCSSNGASDSRGVRPSFAICKANPS